MIVGLLHPGEMGAAIGDALAANGHDVIWASEGRSDETRARAKGFRDVVGLDALLGEAETVLSICPPHAALEVAQAAADFTGIYVDANAISPETARTIAGLHPRFVDGGIVGPPPRESGTTRLYLAGGEADRIAGLFAGTNVDARVLSGEPGAASALKATYAGWTKGSAALLLAMRELARAEAVEDALLAEWRLSLPGLEEEYAAAARSADRKGWRWVGEMREISRTMAGQDLPTGFHEAAAEIFRRSSGES